MDADLDTLRTALYVHDRRRVEDRPALAPMPAGGGDPPKLSDAELMTLAVVQACSASAPRPGSCARPKPTSATCSPTCPTSPATTSACGAAAGQLQRADPGARPKTPTCGATTPGWWTRPRSSAGGPDRPPSARIWPASPATATAPATRATSGGSASTSSCTPAGLPVTFALANPKVDEREVARDLFVTPWAPSRSGTNRSTDQDGQPPEGGGGVRGDVADRGCQVARGHPVHHPS